MVGEKSKEISVFIIVFFLGFKLESGWFVRIGRFLWVKY